MSTLGFHLRTPSKIVMMRECRLTAAEIPDASSSTGGVSARQTSSKASTTNGYSEIQCGLISARSENTCKAGMTRAGLVPLKQSRTMTGVRDSNSCCRPDDRRDWRMLLNVPTCRGRWKCLRKKSMASDGYRSRYLAKGEANGLEPEYCICASA